MSSSGRRRMAPRIRTKLAGILRQQPTCTRRVSESAPSSADWRNTVNVSLTTPGAAGPQPLLAAEIEGAMMRNVGIRCEYVGYTRCGHRGLTWSSLSPPEAVVVGCALPVITQLDTCMI